MVAEGVFFLYILILLIGGYITLTIHTKGTKLDPIEKIFGSLVFFFVLVLYLFFLNFLLNGTLFKNPNFLRSCFAVLVIAFFINNILKKSYPSTKQEIIKKFNEIFYFITDKYNLILIILLSFIVVFDTNILHLKNFWISGDMDWHLGWANQISIGNPLPSSPYQNVPNHYPYLFHASLSFIKQFFNIPMIDAYSTLTIIQILILPISVYVFTYYLTQNKPISLLATYFSSFSGGFGWIKLLGSQIPILNNYGPEYYGIRLKDIFLNEFSGDLLGNNAYNTSLTNLAPAYPRDLSYSLFVPALYFLLRGINEDNKRLQISSGILIAILAFVHINSYMLVMSILLISSLIYYLGNKKEFAKRIQFILFIAIAVSLIKWIPFINTYLTMGGLVSTTLMKPLMLPLFKVINSFGFVAIFSLPGLILIKNLKHRSFLWIVLAVSSIFLLIAYLNNILQISEITILRPRNWWTSTYTVLSIVSAVSFYRLIIFLRERKKFFAYLITLIVVISGAISPIINSVWIYEYSKVKGPYPEQDIYRISELPMDKKDVVLFHPGGGNVGYIGWMGFTFWKNTGINVVLVHRPRIPWRNIYSHITPQEEREVDMKIIFNNASTETIEKLLEKYAVTYVFVRPGSIEKILPVKTLRHRLQKNSFILYQRIPNQFFDDFKTERKIASKENITVTNGDITLSRLSRTPTNLVLNPSFEKGVDNPENWDAAGSPFYESVECKSGRCVKVDVNDYYYQEINSSQIKNRTTYIYSIHAKQGSLKSNSARVMVRTRSSDKKDIYHVDWIKVNSSYAKYEKQFTTPKDTESVHVYVTGTDNNGWMYMDDLSLVEEAFETLGYIESIVFETENSISSVTPTWNTTEPAGTAIIIEISVDNGKSWSRAENGVTINYTINDKNKNLLYRAFFQTNDIHKSPILHDIAITYEEKSRGR